MQFFVLEAVCIGCFSLEFVLRLLASPATIGLGAFLHSIPNWIDIFAIAPFYVDLIIMNFTSGDIGFLAVLRIIRLSRIFRVLKVPSLAPRSSHPVSLGPT